MKNIFRIKFDTLWISASVVCLMILWPCDYKVSSGTVGIKGRERLNVGWGEVNESTVVLARGQDTCCPLCFSSAQRFACQRCWRAPLSSSRPIVSQNPLTPPHLTPPDSGCTAVIHPCILTRVLVKPLNQVNHCKNVAEKSFQFKHSKH